MLRKAHLIVVMTSIVAFGLAQAAENLEKGIGPVKSLKLEALNEGTAKEGKTLFEAKCSACHKMAERYVGPSLKEVTKRRTPEWIMNMILNPAEMLEKDETAQGLLGEYMTPMTFQNVSEADARKILEYFRYYDEKGEIKSAAGGKAEEKKPAKPAAKTKKK